MKRKRTVTASAPGKCIITGEHFVVHGEPALVMAINRRVYVESRLKEGSDVQIASEDLGLAGCFIDDEYKPILGGMRGEAVLKPVKAAVMEVFKEAKTVKGLDLRIRSQIPVSSGLGSSAALVVASIAAVSRLLEVELSKEELFKLAVEAEKVVHVKPSGIDPLISIGGGIIAFRREEGFLPVKSPVSLPLVLGNTKTPRSTGEMVNRVAKLKEKYPEIIDPLFHSAGRLTIKAIEAVRSGDLVTLGELMNINHELLSAIGVSTPKLDNLVRKAREAGALGAKLTGAGGGGFMVALCPKERVSKVFKAIKNAKGEPYEARLEEEGVIIEEDERLR
ncbi:MAG: mevalonate kinase [Candidatus Nezhaarchaeales archaeon]